MERRQADVGDFFFTESDGLRRPEIELLRRVRGRRCRCGGPPDQPKGQTGSAQSRHRRLGYTLPLRSLFLTWHRRILHTSELFFDSSRSDPTLRGCPAQDTQHTLTYCCTFSFHSS